MLTASELKFIEQEIKKTISSIENTYWNEFRYYLEDPGREDTPGYTKEWIGYRIKDLYNLIRMYLEGKGLVVYLEDFYQKYDALMNKADTDFTKATLYHPDSEEELIFIGEFKQFLDPLKAFDYSDRKEEEINKLTNILKHTDHILKNIGKTVKNEADIYNKIKWILGLYYPTTRFKNKASFIRQFKTYEPDILIPELKTAIEYKLIKDRKATIDDYIDLVKADSANYTGDHLYEQFVAVLYITDSGIATQEAIESAWAHKKFPDNWKLVVAMGS
jgi:hypothetical protein